MTAEFKYTLVSIATLVGLLMLSGLSFIAPLVCWLVWRKSDPSLAEFALHRVNACLTLLAGIVLFYAIGYFVFFAAAYLMGIMGLIWLVFGIIDVIKSIKGDEYTYPLTIPFIK